MIQRIQTIYLLVAALSLMFYALFAIPGAESFGEFMGIRMILMTLVLVVSAAVLAAVFLFRNRKKQRIVVLSLQWASLVCIILTGLVLYYIPAVLEATAGLYGVVVFLPLPLGYVLLRLAQRAIEKDIALVKSMDRIR
jgi:hypothetical protein